MPSRNPARALPLQTEAAGVLPMGLARLATQLYRGGDSEALRHALLQRLAADANDAAAKLDLGTLLQLTGRREEGLDCQRQALALQQTFHLPARVATRARLRLLMLATPGDFMANTPVEFLLEGAPVSLDIVYLRPGAPMPASLPEHDALLVGIAESAEARADLMRLSPVLATWPKPVLNAPARIIALARERLWEVLAACPGIEIPATVRVGREELQEIAAGALALDAVLPGGRFPIIARPAGSHAGAGLQKLDVADAAAAYLAQEAADAFYLANFVDYRSPDGQHRKYRIACIGGRFFLCHLAIGSHWMLHYLNAGMHEDAGKRAEEARAMVAFDDDFGPRHAQALAGLSQALDLDYFAIDCAESPDGRLLVFEAGTAMIVHRMDPPDLFPYKQVQMQRVCDAFVALLAARACDAAIKANMR